MTDSESLTIQGNEAEENLDNWDQHPKNPFNWTTWQKARQMTMLTSTALLASIGTSIISPARSELEETFHVGGTTALLPLSLYCLALGVGPVVGGPLSEVFGRYPIYLYGTPLGALFTLGAGFTHNFGSLCFLRFMAGLCWAPSLAVATGSVVELFRPQHRGVMMALFILMPFLGPGLGPLIGGFVVTGKSWRWTQWTLIFFAIFSILATVSTSETYHSAIKQKLVSEKAGSSKAGEKAGPQMSSKFKDFVNVALIRPLSMLVSEPIVAFLCLYIAAEFGTLFSFFAAVPYTFETTYGFSTNENGLVFIAIVVGCVLAIITVILCEKLLYLRKSSLHSQNGRVPPEERLYPAMFGSIGLPLGLFWFAWTARPSISWASPAVSLIIFAWGNLCIFVSAFQYMAETYHGSVLASVASANSFARYGLAAAFPLFTIQMYEKLGINWASSLLGFISIALMPLPWILYKFGPVIRAKSKYETA